MTEDQIKDLFRYSHLPEDLQAVSKPFHDLALQMREDNWRMDGTHGGEVVWDAIKLLWDVKNRAVWARVEMKRREDQHPMAT